MAEGVACRGPVSVIRRYSMDHVCRRPSKPVAVRAEPLAGRTLVDDVVDGQEPGRSKASGGDGQELVAGPGARVGRRRLDECRRRPGISPGAAADVPSGERGQTGPPGQRTWIGGYRAGAGRSGRPSGYPVMAGLAVDPSPGRRISDTLVIRTTSRKPTKAPKPTAFQPFPW